MFQKLLLLTVLTVSLTFAAPSLKIDPNLSKTLQFKNVSNIFVKFESVNEVINKVNTIQFATRGQKITHLVSSLKDLASCQENALGLLEKESFKQFWVSNELFVKDATAELVRELARLPEVKEVREELVLNLIEDKPVEIVEDGWNLERIEAPNAWQLPGGNNGQGVVIANIDTGVRATHEALRGNFRSSYGWFDPYDGTDQPRDEIGHGTHTMGVMVGAGVGVAPGAQWISCQGCLFASCTESALKSCGQWVICPTLPDGTGEDCEKAPRIVSNSWGGQGNNDWFNGVIAAWQGANIIPVFALGNSGSGCYTAGSPADQDGVIAVTSTNMADSLSASASNGPAFDGRIKPDLSAPGQEIRSAWNTDDSAYQVISGTSMAAPHVAGSAALLLSRNPNLTYNQVKSLLEENADTESLPDLNKSCNGIPSTEFPNNQYGHGRLNSRKSLEAAINTK